MQCIDSSSSDEDFRPSRRPVPGRRVPLASLVVISRLLAVFCRLLAVVCLLLAVVCPLLSVVSTFYKCLSQH